MTAEEIVGLVRDNVQIFDIEPLLDGFPDDPITRGGTKILDQVNYIRYQLAQKGIMQCFRDTILATDQIEYRLKGDFLTIHYAYLIDPDSGQVTQMMPGDVSRMMLDNPQRMNNTYGSKPQKYGTVGSSLSLDTYPDKAYTMRFFCDVLPEPMVGRLDEPSRLDTPLHNVYVSGGSYRVARIALNNPVNRNQFAFARYNELKVEFEADFHSCIGIAQRRIKNMEDHVYINNYTKEETFLW